MAWIYEFDEYEGYDCLTSGFKIMDSEGNNILTVDSKDFEHLEHHPVMPKVDRRTPEFANVRAKHLEALEAWRHRRSPAAEQMARMICARCGD